jgi:hypothetical protein
LFGLPRSGQPVAKATDRPIAVPDLGSKRQKTGLSMPERGLEKGTEEFFNRLASLLGTLVPDLIGTLDRSEARISYGSLLFMNVS